MKFLSPIPSLPWTNKADSDSVDGLLLEHLVLAFCYKCCFVGLHVWKGTKPGCDATMLIFPDPFQPTVKGQEQAEHY